MKLHQFAAAMLLVGTSALAWKPAEPVAYGVNDSVTVAHNIWAEWAASSPDLDLAVDPGVADPESADSGAADTDSAGVGGPEEPVDAASATTTAALDLTPRPATQNYPPCDPGPGDDNCIQLYEPGVRTALASWSQPTGGLGDGSPGPATAMGGPYEPVAGGTSETAMNGDGVVDAALGETASSELATSELATSELATSEVAHLLSQQQGAEYAGMGGPLAETGYPACRPGPGDDRCIQLYERGVTGAGN